MSTNLVDISLRGTGEEVIILKSQFVHNSTLLSSPEIQSAYNGEVLELQYDTEIIKQTIMLIEFVNTMLVDYVPETLLVLEEETYIEIDQMVGHESDKLDHLCKLVVFFNYIEWSVGIDILAHIMRKYIAPLYPELFKQVDEYWDSIKN
jgi:hypothetical protein